jgi:hypothetical protein
MSSTNASFSLTDDSLSHWSLSSVLYLQHIVLLSGDQTVSNTSSSSKVIDQKLYN